MADLVVDSNVWVASFVMSGEWHQRAQQFLGELQAQQHVCHLPNLVLVETCAAIGRRMTKHKSAEVLRARQSFLTWEQGGFIVWYELTQSRASSAIDIATQLGLKGSDGVIVALATELNIQLMTFDTEILQRFQDAVQ